MQNSAAKGAFFLVPRGFEHTYFTMYASQKTKHCYVYYLNNFFTRTFAALHADILAKQEKWKQTILVINSDGDVWKVSVTKDEELKEHLECPEKNCHTHRWSEK